MVGAAMWMMEFNLGLLEEQPGPLAPELSLQLLICPYMSMFIITQFTTDKLRN